MGSIESTKRTAAQGLPVETLSSLLTGIDFWHTIENQELGFGSVRFSDGPNGVRGEDWVNGAPSAALPCATAFGASFDKELVFKAAELLATECDHKGAHALLAPTMNIHRYALCGRNFESFSEDPYLTGALATAYVKGLQKHGVAAAPKHFLANEAENGRRWSNSVIDERALREIYLEPFRMVVQDANPWALMTAYNSVNGNFCSESSELLNILRNEWKFSGVVISDWFGTYSTAPALNAGLDLELPGPCKFRTPELLQKALENGLVSRQQLEESASRVIMFLEVTQRAGPPGSAPPCKKAQKSYVEAAGSEDFLVKAAEATMVLLKNERHTLPLGPVAAPTRLGVFGEHAKTPSLFGGGSASLKVPSTTPSAWDAISSSFPSAIFSQGVGIDRLVKSPVAQGLDLGEITLDWYNGPQVQSDKKFFSQYSKDTVYMMVEDVPEGLIDKSDFTNVLSFTYTPATTAQYNLSISGPGDTVCTVNGRVELEAKRTLDVSTEDYLFDRSKLEVQRQEPLLLEGGESYMFQITSWSSKHKAENVNREFFIQGCRFGLEVARDEDAGLAQARSDASNVDHAIVVVGTGPEWESEGFDRVSIQLPRRQNELIRAVAGACPGRTTVVVNCGSPIDMSSWIDDVDAVIEAWFPGMGFAQGLVNLLTGSASPSARLPTTFWDNVEDYPAGHVESLMTCEKNIEYREGIYVGYRQFTARGCRSEITPPRFPFAHGLSYTTFEYKIDGPVLVKSHLENEAVDVCVNITNVGQRSGAETALLFLQPLNTGQPRPEVELVAFDKTQKLGVAESEALTLRVSKRSAAYWDIEEGVWRVEAGLYQVLFVGPRGVGDWRCAGQKVIEVPRGFTFSD
ncbi:hypothetical protein VTL71DRAFT_15775 [Oculimacula yallundae]|uniref:beta-glucosidase n=1 Tax=Oculimacula yallundae TaxID=86028 RepID=A0ABR4CCN5_9HELO